MTAPSAMPGMLAAAALMAVCPAAAAPAGEVRLAENGRASCVVVAPAGWASDAAIPAGLPPKAALRPGYALTPFDGQVPTEDPTERVHDPEPRIWEPAAGRWSVTDRCMLLHNRIAEKVRAKYPKVAFGDLAHVNKMYPPAKQPLPKDFHITIAPIDFNRHHPMDWPDHPNEYWVRDLVQGWGSSAEVSCGTDMAPT